MKKTIEIILNTEKKAKELVADAKERANKIISDAEETIKKEMEKEIEMTIIKSKKEKEKIQKNGDDEYKRLIEEEKIATSILFDKIENDKIAEEVILKIFS